MLREILERAHGGARGKARGPSESKPAAMNVLVVDIGGRHAKGVAPRDRLPRKFVSGPTLTPAEMIDGVKKIARGWKYDVVAMGYPGVVLQDRPVAEPH